jgi:serine/threonine protein kinase
LGVGGQATVYLAIQQGFDREVALKVMSPALAADPTFGERFIREAKIVARLRHPGIVTVYDVGEHDGFYYLAMEYLPEKDLRSRINEGMKAKDALQVIAKVSRALHFAHEKGYIHRDVKSENILFRDDGEPVLTDFGIAKASNSSTQMTQQGKLIGTPQYMSPEQCRGRPLDGRSDLYSLGVILYEMLTQSVPYDGEDSVAVCLQHVTKPIPRLPARQKHYQWLIDRILAKKPENRFASGNELAEAIDKFLAGDLSATQKQVKAELIAEREHNIESVFADDEHQVLPDDRISVQSAEEKKQRWPWVVASVLVIGAVAFLQQAHWLPQAKKLLSGWTQTPSVATDDTRSSIRQTQNPPGLSSPKTAENRNAEQGETPGLNGLTAEQEARQKQIAQLLVEADSLEPLPDLEPTELKKLLQNYLRILVLEPEHKQAKQRKEAALTRAADYAIKALNEGNEDAYHQYVAVIESVAPQHALLDKLSREFQKHQLALQDQAQQAALQQQISELLVKAEQAAKEKRLMIPENDSAYFYYAKVLQLNPSHPQAQSGLLEIKNHYLKLAQHSLLNKKVEQAREAMNKLKKVAGVESELNELEQQYQIIKQQVEEERRKAALEAEQRRKQQERERMLADPLVQLKIKSKLNAARNAYRENRLVLPEEDNALAKYQEVLAIDPDHAEAKEGIDLIQSKLVSLVKDAIAQGDKKEAERWLAQLSAFFAQHPELPLLKQQVAEMDLLLLPESSNDSSQPMDTQLEQNSEFLSENSQVEQKTEAQKSSNQNPSNSEANNSPLAKEAGSNQNRPSQSSDDSKAKSESKETRSQVKQKQPNDKQSSDMDSTAESGKGDDTTPIRN